MFIRSRSLDMSPQCPTSVTKPRKSQKTGLLARLFATKIAKSGETTGLKQPCLSTPTPKQSSSPTRDTFVEDVKRALFAQMRSTAGKVVFKSSTTPPRSPTPDLVFGTPSGASTPISSGVCTPISCPSPVFGSPVKHPDVKTYGSWCSVAVTPPSTSPEFSPRPRFTGSQKDVVPPIRPLPIRKPKVRPCQSKSSQWRRSACSPIGSPRAPPPISIHKDVADELLVLKSLKPIPRYNPFLRPRAESLSSIVDETRRKPGSLVSPSIRVRRNSTMSGLPTPRRASHHEATKPFVL